MQGRAVADRDDRRVRQLLADDLVDLRLGPLVEGGRGLVEKQPVRLREERPRDGEALLFPEGEGLAPDPLLVEPVGDLWQLRAPKRVGISASVKAPSAAG